MLQWISIHWELLIMLSQFRLSFCQTQNRMPYFIVELMSILVLIGMVFVIIGEMFHGRISLNSVLLLLLVNFVSEFRVESMYISLIVSIKSRVTHLHGFQLVFFVATVHINHFVCLYQQNKSSESKGKFLKLPNSHMLLKQKSVWLHRNLALGTYGELLLVFSAQVNLLYLICSTAQRCCLLYLRKQNCLLKTF